MSAAENLDLIVREKAHDRSEGRVSPDCRCLHLGSSQGCGPARPCSPGIRRDNFHISPRPPAPLLCCLDEGEKGMRSGHDQDMIRRATGSTEIGDGGCDTYRPCGGDCVALLSLW